MLIKNEKSFYLTFLHNVMYAAIINTILAFVFIRAVDNISNPFNCFVALTLLSACVMTAMNYKKSSIKNSH